MTGILAAVIATAFLAAVCQSFTAFGFALVMVPLLSLAWEVKPSVVTSTLLSTISLLPLLLEARAHIPVARVAPMFAGGIAGVPLGILLLYHVGSATLQVFVASVVIVATLSLYFSPHLRLARPH